MRSNGFLLIIIGALLVASACALTATLRATASNSIISGNKVCGLCQELTVTNTASSSSNASALIKWDLSSLPSDAAISRATISLFITSPGNNIPILAASVVPAKWNQSLARASGMVVNGDAPLNGDPTWENSAYPSTAWATPGAAGGEFLAYLPTDLNGVGDTGVQDVEISSAVVSNWRSNPSSNTGIVVQLFSSLGRVLFGSHFNTNENVRPMLTIEYTSSQATPPPPAKSVNYAPPPGRGVGGVPYRATTTSASGAVIGGVIGGVMGVFVIITIATIILRS